MSAYKYPNILEHLLYQALKNEFVILLMRLSVNNISQWHMVTIWSVCVWGVYLCYLLRFRTIPNNPPSHPPVAVCVLWKMQFDIHQK